MRKRKIRTSEGASKFSMLAMFIGGILNAGLDLLNEGDLIKIPTMKTIDK